MDILGLIDTLVIDYRRRKCTSVHCASRDDVLHGVR
jgi:hypothetical protein